MKKTYILMTMLFALAGAGCKKSLDQSINPNQPSNATPGVILSGAEAVSAVRVSTDYTQFGIWLGYYAPSGSVTSSSSSLLYTITSSSFNGFWNNNYVNLANYNFLIQKAAADPSLKDYGTISKIMECYIYQNLVDWYGDIAYSQALNSAVYLFPKYDKATDVYADLMVQLDAAIAAAGTGNTVGSSDVIFQGNMAKWAKFANTIKLRIAVRQSNIAANKAGLVTELAKTAATGYLDDATFAAVNPGYSNSDNFGGQQDPYYLQNGFTVAGKESNGHSNNRASTFLINFLTNLNDPRIGRFYTQVGGAYVGTQLGNANNGSNTATSSLSTTGILNPTISQPLISGSEACFLQAEAIVDGFIPGAGVNGSAVTGSAQNLYERGITASFTALGVPNLATAAPAYYNQPIVDVSWVASAASSTPKSTLGPLVKAIITQKYIANFGYEVQESYNDYRRTGFPNLSGARTVSGGANGNALQPVPNRIQYPITEQNTNTASYNSEPAFNSFTDALFWALPAPYTVLN